MRSMYRKYATNNPFIPVAILIILVIILGIICYYDESNAQDYPRINNDNPKIEYDEQDQVVKPLVNNDKPDPKSIAFNSPIENNYEDYDQDRIIYLPRHDNRQIIRRPHKRRVFKSF